MDIQVDNLIALNLSELRALWALLWGKKPHAGIYRNLLEKSILFKKAQLKGKGFCSKDQMRLNHLIKQYRRNPESLVRMKQDLNPGTMLMRIWQGKKYIVIVKENEFEYEGKLYKSLSKIAFTITGTKWNGWSFFGLKNKKKVK